MKAQRWVLFATILLLTLACGKPAETHAFSILGSWEYESPTPIRYSFKDDNKLTSFVRNEYTLEGTYELTGDALVLNEVLTTDDKPLLKRNLTKVDDNTFKDNADGILMKRK